MVWWSYNKHKEKLQSQRQRTVMFKQKYRTGKILKKCSSQFSLSVCILFFFILFICKSVFCCKKLIPSSIGLIYMNFLYMQHIPFSLRGDIINTNHPKFIVYKSTDHTFFLEAWYTLSVHNLFYIRQFTSEYMLFFFLSIYVDAWSTQTVYKVSTQNSQ